MLSIPGYLLFYLIFCLGIGVLFLGQLGVFFVVYRIDAWNRRYFVGG